MIRSSNPLKIGVVFASAVSHVAVGWYFFSEPRVEIAGGAGVVVEARLGNSFEDLAAGAAVAEVSETPEAEPVEIETAEPPAETTKAPPETAMPVLPSETVTARGEVVPSEAAPVGVPEMAVPLPVEAAPPADAIATLVPVEQAEPQKVEQAPARRDVKPLAAVQETVPAPSPPVIETETPKLTQASKPETLAATEDDNALGNSPRPARRPDRPRRDARETAPPPQAQGNSNRNAIAGSASGSSTARATEQSSNSGRSTASGNAAVSNYPGKVMQRIARVRRPRVGSRGAAVIRFSISANGALARVSVARSSGSARLDRAALQVVQRAAPFPKPPPGAQRNFNIRIEGQG